MHTKHCVSIKIWAEYSKTRQGNEEYRKIFFARIHRKIYGEYRSDKNLKDVIKYFKWDSGIKVMVGNKRGKMTKWMKFAVIGQKLSWPESSILNYWSVVVKTIKMPNRIKYFIAIKRWKLYWRDDYRVNQDGNKTN